MQPATYRRILLPLDSSLLAEAAIPHALAHALRHGAAVHIVHVIDPVDAAPPLHNVAERLRSLFQDPRATIALDAWRVAAQGYVDAVASDLSAAGAAEVTTRVLDGNPREVLEAECAAAGCDFVVLATHGRSGLERAVMGSVAEHIVRSAVIGAVQVVRPEAAR